MRLPSEQLADIADYCRVDAEDRQLPGAIAAAKGYMAEAGVSEPEEGTPRAAQYLQCVKYLTLDMYDRRDVSVAGAAADNTAFRRLITQMKLSEPVSDLDTAPGEGEP